MKTIELLSCIKERRDISEWTFEGTIESGYEAFYTGSRLDMRRGITIQRAALTVHVDKTEGRESTRGSATISIPPSADISEVHTLLDKAVARASVSPGPAWRLPKHQCLEKLREILEPMEEAYPPLGIYLHEANSLLNAALEKQSARFASIELFEHKRNRQFYASTGLSIAWSDRVLEGEFTATSEDGTIELTDQWTWAFDERGDTEAWKAAFLIKIQNLLKSTERRALAIPLEVPEGIPVLLRGAAVQEFFSHFFFQVSAAQVRSGSSAAGIGVSLIDKSENGDSLSIGFDPHLPGSPQNRPVDEDGFLLGRTELVKAGLVLALEGPARHAAALGIPPVGSCASTWVLPGTLKDTDLEGIPYLEALVFSDFYMDETSGEFGGELRLGLYHDGKNETPMTGGSISGSVSQEQVSFRFCADSLRTGSFLGPSGVLIRYPRIKNKASVQ